MRTSILNCGICLILAGAVNYRSNAQNLGINATGAAPDNSAILDLDVSGLPANDKKGLLIPRVALTSQTDATTIPSPATSLLVYNTGTGGLVPAGYYYNAGTPNSPKWVKFLNTGTPSDAWLTSGNAGTTPGTHFIGTTDTQDLVFKTNNTERIRILQNNGNVGINTSIPTSKLQVVDYYDITTLLNPFASSSGKLPGISAYDATDFIGITTLDRDTNPSTPDDKDGVLYWGDNYNQDRLRIMFMEWDGTKNNPKDIITILPNGNVGFGLTNPAYQIHVKRNVGTSCMIEGGSSGLGYTNAAIILKSNYPPGNYRGLGIFMYDSATNVEWYCGRPYGGSFGTNDMFVITQNPNPSSIGGPTSGITDGGGNPTNTNFYFVIRNNGNIGIGLTHPTERLDVAGNIKFSGDLRPSGVPGTTGQVLVSQGAGNPPIWSSAISGMLAGAWEVSPTTNAISINSTTWTDTDVTLTFNLTKPCTVYMLYSINVQPNASPGDDYVMTRLNIDGQPDRTTASHFQPYCNGDCNVNLNGTKVMTMAAGVHTVTLQWRTWKGTITWSNDPNWCDGYCGARKLVVLAYYQ